MALMLLGCNRSFNLDGQEEDCLLTLNIGGEVYISESPMTKTASSDDLYILQVYRNDARLPYASGIFDNVDDLKVYLKMGGAPNVQHYYIVVSLIRNGKTILRNIGKYSDINNSVYVESMATTLENGQVVKLDKSHTSYNYNLFVWNQARDAELWLAVNEMFYNDYSGSKTRKGIAHYKSANSTDLQYSDLERVYKYGNYSYTNSLQPEFLNIGLTNPYSYSYSNSTANIHNKSKNYKCDDWLYGCISIGKNDVNGTMITKTVELKRVGFQIQLDPVMGITDGSVSVKVRKSLQNQNVQSLIDGTFTDETTECIGPIFYAFPDADQVWSNAGDYEEEYNVTVDWLRGIGVSQNFGSIKVKMKRNRLNHIKITVGTDDGNAGMSMVVEPDGGDGDVIEADLNIKQ